MPGAVLALLLAVPAAAAPRPYADHVLATVVPKSDVDVGAIWRLSEHVLSPHDPHLGPHALLVTPAAVARLRALGLEVTVAPVDASAMFAAPAPPPAMGGGRLGIFGAWFGQTEDLAAIDDYLDELSRASNGRAQVMVVGVSIEGRPIRALRIGDPTRPARASILVTGTQHAREWASPMVTMGFADALVRQAATDARVAAILTVTDVYVIPVVNVDGYVASHNGLRMQRKNMNPRCGVDLNRNFDVAFGAGLAPDGCDQENFPGAAAFSEPETRAVKALGESLTNLRLYLDYHSPAESVLIPYAFTRTRPPGYDKSVAWAQLYSSTLQSLYDTLHPAREAYDLAQGQGGGAIDWFRMNLAESFAVELRDGREQFGFQLPAEQIIPSVEENWIAFRALAWKVAEENGAIMPGDPVMVVSSSSSGCSFGGTAGAGRGLLALTALVLVAFARRGRRRI
jgi:hypothetical protein